MFVISNLIDLGSQLSPSNLRSSNGFSNVVLAFRVALQIMVGPVVLLMGRQLDFQSRYAGD